MYWIDTPTGRIDAFDYDLDTGRVSGRRPHVVIDEEWGSPDGMCIDDEDRLWVAARGPEHFARGPERDTRQQQNGVAAGSVARSATTDDRRENRRGDAG